MAEEAAERAERVVRSEVESYIDRLVLESRMDLMDLLSLAFHVNLFQLPEGE